MQKKYIGCVGFMWIPFNICLPSDLILLGIFIQKVVLLKYCHVVIQRHRFLKKKYVKGVLEVNLYSIFRIGI